jgi:VWFA-related protein
MLRLFPPTPLVVSLAVPAGALCVALAWTERPGLTAAAAAQSPPASSPAPQQPSPPPSGAQPAPADGRAGQQTQAPQPPAPPAFRTGINFVRVDALVTDSKGNAIRDLTQADFDVLEDGKSVKLETFKFIEVSGTPAEGELPKPIRTTWDEETELAREDTRLFVIFYDDYHVRRGSALAAKEPIIRFIRNNLGAMDIVGVMYPLTPYSTIGYTRNHEGLIREVERWDGRKHDYTPRNEFEERYVQYPAEVVERIRNQVSLSALKTLVQGLGTVREGRKSVILVSEGYSNYLPPQLRDPVANMPGYGNPNARGRTGTAGERTPQEQMNEERAEFFSNTDLLTDLREVFTAANRSNVAIYALDPRGLAAFEYDIDQGVGLQRDRAGLTQGLNTLRTLADETDGRAIVNSNDLQAGLKQMVKDASSYYLLGYTTQSPTDGKFHEIKVRVKRPGAQVRSRKGFWALTNADVTAATSAAAKPPVDPAVDEALSAIATPLRARIIRTWIGTSRGENGRTAVTLVWEPAQSLTSERRETPSRVSVMAGGQGGSYYRGKVPEPAAEPASSGGSNGTVATSSTPAGAGGGGRITFQAPPGTMQMRLSVEGETGQVLDTDFRDLVIPDYTKPEPALSVPAVYRARTARDIAQLVANPEARPTTSREFSRTERLLFRVRAYAPGGGVAAPSARLLNRGGNKMADVNVKPAPSLGEHGFEAELPLASLPAGEFLVELFLDADGKQAKQYVAFRVTS